MNGKIGTGLFYIAVGVGIMLASSKYEIGTLSRMGPGYFPFVLGGMMCALGALVLVGRTDKSPKRRRTEKQDHALRSGLSAHSRDFRAWFAGVGGMAVFILLGEHVGLIAATFGLVFVATFGNKSNTLFNAIVIGVLTVIFGVIVFHFGMQLQFPLFIWR